ncbi:exo-beta-N-acetylmuramidase NamZ domain-containing protein [Methylicorpusculum sp.]|uniref:exo-beta-N-acetylmuramidase NamZ domain-containing protein n=1 Tax=Methylicorpusculum sp. TaxID=2713644 RepID=UPI002ABCCDC0|nr:exo-beta-N-acetylmuramidase NamZ domain-containing protein [Methylicorpusculum sp.]MDZ4153461.1 DUF1343 domain-containing protein [Methylicorpusculum sp.]
MIGGLRGFTTVKSIIKILSVWIFAFLVPKIYVWHQQPVRCAHPSVIACRNGAVQGADLLFAMRNNNQGATAPKSIALVAGDMSRLHSCAVTTDFLLKKGFHIKKIFVPWYVHSTGKTVSLGRARKIPIERIAQDGTFTKNQVRGVDLLVFAMQDSRMEHALYASTLTQTMKAASQYKKMLVIMDHHHEGDFVPLEHRSLKKYARGPLVPESIIHKPLDHIICI